MINDEVEVGGVPFGRRRGAAIGRRLPWSSMLINRRTRRVTRLVALGDRARGRGNWAVAAQHYKRALDIDPRLALIWVQYGHALKESGWRSLAEAAYRRAIAQDSAVPDSHLQLGHLLKLEGRRTEAAGAYFTAHVLDPALADARVELSALGYPPLGSEAERYAAEREALEREHQATHERYAAEREVLEREYRAAHDILLQHHAEILEAAGQRANERTKETVGALERAHREAREAFELQLFALRCDLQRAVNHSAQQGESARAAEDAAKELGQTIESLHAEKVELERRIAEIEARGGGAPVTQGDFNRLQANLLGRVSLVSSDIDRLRRIFEPKDGHPHPPVGDTVGREDAPHINAGTAAPHARVQVFDCFNFFNELELLAIRLEELDDVVDVFVIGESTKTFQGDEKPLFFHENRDRFARHSRKIRHVIIDDDPVTENPWDRERHQRNCLRRGFVDADPFDSIMISDVDEIPSQNSVREAASRGHFCYFTLDLFYHAFNLILDNPKRAPWTKSYMAPASVLADHDLDVLRLGGLQVLASQGLDGNSGIVDLGGWHFSSVGGVEAIITKLRAFSHTEPEVTALIDPGLLSKHLESRTVFFSGEPLINVSPLFNFPRAIATDPERFRSLGLLTDDYQAGARYDPRTRAALWQALAPSST